MVDIMPGVVAAILWPWGQSPYSGARRTERRTKTGSVMMSELLPCSSLLCMVINLCLTIFELGFWSLVPKSFLLLSAVAMIAFWFLEHITHSARSSAHAISLCAELFSFLVNVHPPDQMLLLWPRKMSPWHYQSRNLGISFLSWLLYSSLAGVAVQVGKDEACLCSVLCTFRHNCPTV